MEYVPDYCDTNPSKDYSDAVLKLWSELSVTSSGGRGVIFKAGGFLALFGAYLVWMDFLSPNREQP